VPVPHTTLTLRRVLACSVSFRLNLVGQPQAPSVKKAKSRNLPHASSYQHFHNETWCHASMQVRQEVKAWLALGRFAARGLRNLVTPSFSMEQELNTSSCAHTVQTLVTQGITMPALRLLYVALQVYKCTKEHEPADAAAFHLSEHTRPVT